MHRLSLTTLALLFSTPALAQLSQHENKIISTIDSEADRTLGLLERMVNQNSGTHNFAGVRAVGEMLRPEFEALGFKVDWIDVPETNRAGHFHAVHKGNGRGKRMLLIAHIDTVFEPDSPFQKYSRQGDKAFGPGVVDNKGGIAVIVAALRAMHAAGTLKNADITVAITGDEEKSGRPVEISRRDLIAAAKWADISLEFENLAREDGKDFGTIARRSSNNWTLKVSAKTGHSGGVFSQNAGYGSIYEAARILDGWRSNLIVPNLTFNAGLIAGGTPASVDADGVAVQAVGKTNIIPSTTIVRGDLRSLTPEQGAAAREKMQAIAANNLPGTTAELTFGDGKPPLSPTAGNRALLSRLNKINADLGLAEMGEYDPAKRGAADSAYVAAYTDVLAGMGPSGTNLHADGEWLDIPSIWKQAKRGAILITRLSREKR